MEGRQRITLLHHLSAVDDHRRQSLTLEDIFERTYTEQSTHALPSPLPPPPPAALPAQPVTHAHTNRTLLQIIKDEHSREKERNPWKALKDRLRLKRPRLNWTNNSGSELTRSMTQDDSPRDNAEDNSSSLTPSISRIGSTLFSATRSESTLNTDSSEPEPAAFQDLRPISYHGSIRQLPTSEPQKRERRTSVKGADAEGEDESDEQPDSARERTSLSDDRTLSFREAVAAQEAAEAAVAAAAEAEASADAAGGGAMKMSLMDLLEEEGSSYMMGDDDDDNEEEEEDEGEVDEKKPNDDGNVEYNCCICMVRHKGAAFIPCGHAFCRLCSRELYVSRGSCPLCNNFIAEILDIF